MPSVAVAENTPGSQPHSTNFVWTSQNLPRVPIPAPIS